MPEDKLPIPQFAAKIKAKYPEYKDVNDTLLVKRIVEKYPEYKESVDLSGIEEPVKKKETVSPLGGKVGNFAGRLDVGTWGSESVDEGKPVGKALGKVSGITTPEQAKISRVNKAFRKIESFAGSREDFEEIYKQSPQEFDNLAKQVAPNVNKREIDKFYTTEAARKDAYVDRVFQSYKQQKTKAQLESARRYRPVIESQFYTATIPLSNYTGKQYQLPQSEAQVSEILTDLRNEKEKLKTELTTNWNLSEVETKAKELSDIESAIKQNLTYQVGRMALERLSQNNPNVTSREIGEEVFRVLHPDEYGLYKKVKGSTPVSFTVGTQRETPVEADMLNEQMVQVGNEIKRMYGNETAIQDADIEEQTAKRKYTFGRQSQVKQKLAAILNERGIKPHKATEAQKDQAAMLLEPEDKETWFENNKTYNNVDLPSTGFAYSLKNAYYNTVKDAVSTVFGGLMPDRKRMRAAEVLEGMTASDVLGEDPQFKARLTQLKDKESTQKLSEQERQEKEQLEQFTDLRNRKQKIFDMAGSGVGQILGLGSISAFTGGLSSARTGVGALKSLVAPSGGRGGIMAASYLMSHENNAKEALRMFPDDKDGLKRFFSTELNTAIDMAVEQIFPEEKFLSGIAKKEVSKLITNLTAKNIASTLNDNAFKQLAKNIVGRSKKLLATPLQETAEEEIALLLKKTFEGIIAPDKSEGLTLKDVVETGEQAFWSSVLLGAPKGVLGYTNNKVPLTALWDAASSQEGYTKTKMTIERLKRDGELTEAEAQDRLDNLELGRNEYLNNPILSGDMGGLDAGQKQNYFARILNEAILKKQADAVTDPNLKKQYEQQIKESEVIREKIYKGEIKVTPENEELTKKEFEKKEKEQAKIDQDRVLGDEEVELTPEQQIIQQAIDNNEVEGMFLDMAKAALSDPQQAKQLLDEAKSQATGQVAGELGSARSGVEKAWGKTIADFVAPKAETPTPTDKVGEQPTQPQVSTVREGDWSKDVESTAKALELSDKTPKELDELYNRLSNSKNQDVRVLANMVENVQEKNERNSILNSPLENVSDIIDNILKQDSYFLEKKEAREAKEVAKKYMGSVSKQDAKKDFKDAFFGNPNTWIADALKMREAVRVFNEQGGTFKELLSSVQKEFEQDGFTEQDAAIVIKNKLNSLIKKDFRQQQLSEAYHKAKADGSNPELVKAVEDLLGKPTQEPTPQPTKAKELADKVRKLKIDLGKLSGGGLQSNPLGLPVAVWNGAMDIIAKTIETGGNIADAIKRGLNYIQKNHRGQWNKKQFNDEVMKELGVRGITVNGEDLVVKDVDKEFAETINGFYSDLEQTILEVSPTDKGTPQAWLKKIGTGDEAKWTGVTDWLNSLPKDQKVTRKEILDWLKENRIQVVEVVKDSQSVTPNKVTEEGDFDYSDQTKFSQYQLEGQKENYKEVLVTLPNKIKSVPFWKLAEGESRNSNGDLIAVKINGEWIDKDEAKIKYGVDYDTINNEPEYKFKSNHFDEPNILVHLRMNTRTDVDGEKVLFIEEIQSDWGQEGKKRGFKGEAKPAKDIFGNIVVQDTKRWEEKIPTAPFVTDTNAWVKLGLKVALKEAVKQGADKIAWTTGEQQNDRYNLAEYVDDVYTSSYSEIWVNGKYEKRKDVEITLKGGGVKKFVVDDSGKVRLGDFVGERLDNVIGKEMAEKILSAQEDTNFGKQDLKVGGKGMKGFYGSPSEGKLGIVGEVAKSLFKQEPKTIELQTTSTGIKTQDMVLRFRDWVWRNKTEEYSYSDAQKDIDTNSELYKEYQKNIITQHSIDITPELKAEADSGLPLFKDIKGRGKEIADKLRKAKIKASGLQSNIAGIPVALYNAAIETIALALEGGATLTQAIQKAINKHKLNQQKGFNQKEFISKLEDATGEKFTDDQQQPPPPQTPKQEPKEVGGEEEKPSGIKKALVSQKTLQEVNLEKVSDKEMMSLGREIINSGEVKPRELVEKIISEKTGVLTPTEVVALITYKADLDNKEREIYEGINKKKEAGEDLGTLQVEAKEIERQIQDYEVMAVITAASQSMAFRLRQKMLDRDYNVITQIEKYKSKNNGVIPQDIENKFRELGKQIDELKKKLFEAESKVEKEAEVDAVNNIKESVDRETAYTEEELNKKIQEGVENEISKIYESLPEEKKSAADKAISALEKFRAKIKSRTYESTLGLPLAIADLGALTTIRAIKVGKTVAEAVEIGIKRIKQALKDKGINKWDEENDYRNELTKTLEEEGVSLKKVKDKPIYNEDGSVSIPHQMIRDLVSKGYTDIESLTDEVYKEVVKELPEITKREVRDYITKYGKEVNPTKDEIEIKINQAKRIGRLLSELEDLQKRKVRSKNGLPLRLTEREKELKRQIRTLAKDLVPKEELSDVEKISAAKERVKNRISELNRRIRNKDFAKPKKVIKPTDEELNKLMAEKERLQEEFETEQYRLEIKNRGFWEKAEDWLMELANGVVRGLVASFDLSAGFVQGVWRLFTNPIKSLNAFGQMFKHLVSEKNAQEYLDKIKASPYYPLIKASKLAIDDKSGKVSVKEGFFISNWVNFIWDKVISSILGFGTKSGINFFKKINPYAASQRAFDGYVNSIRVQSFIELAKALEKEGMTYESNPKDFEKAADFVNTTTGRGGLGQADSSSRWLNIFLFAPRKVISEVKLFTPYAFVYYARMPKSVRKKALANFIKFTSLYFTTNALLWAARKDWGEDDEDDNFWNPNSSDFLTHKINSKRISIGGGMKSILTFQSRLFSGKYTDQYGQTSNLGERYGKTVNTRLDLVWRYILGKASPTVSVAAKKLDEKKGIEVDDSEIIKKLTIPIWLQDLKELYKDNPTEVNAFLTMMAILGANTRTVKKDYKIPTKIEIEGAKVELNSEQQEFLGAEIERRRDMYMEKAKSNRDYENLSDKRKFEISDEINKKAVKEAEQLLVKDRRYKTFFKQKAKQIKEEEKSKKELKEQEKDFINKIIK